MGQAKLGALATSILTRRAGIPVTQIWQWAPSVSNSFLSKGVQSRSLVAAENLQKDIESWTDLINRMDKKPRQPVLMLKQTPLAMRLVGAEFRELLADPHVFDGLFPKAERSNPRHNSHPEMTRDVLKQIPRALTDPVGAYKDMRVNPSHNTLVFLLDVWDSEGTPVIVPVRFNAQGNKGTINLALSTYGKQSRNIIDLALQNDALLYVNRRKSGRWFPASGSNSLFDSSALNRMLAEAASHGLMVKTEGDLDRLKREHHDLYQVNDGVVARGLFNSETNTISLTHNADHLTFSHELGHWYLSNLLELSKLDGTSASIQEDAQAVLKEFGLDSVEVWDALGLEGQRKYHERFAYWTEIYFATSKAPVSGLRKFFDRLGAWIRDVYFKETMIDARGTACKHCYGGFTVRQPSRNNSGIKGKDLGEKTDSRLYGHAVGTGNRLMVA